MHDTLEVSSQVEHPPDIHPLPDSVTAYVSPFMLLQVVEHIAHRVASRIVRLSVHPRTPCAYCGSISKINARCPCCTPRGISQSTGRRERAAEEGSASSDRPWFRAQINTASAYEAFFWGTHPARLCRQRRRGSRTQAYEIRDGGAGRSPCCPGFEVA